jgi:hypothetical protein
VDEIKGQGQAGQEKTQLRIDQSGASTSYANFFLVSTSQEECTVTFGLLGPEEGVVRVSERMVLSPRNAKRLAGALGQAIRMYEDRFGVLNVAPQAGEGAKKQ